MTVKKKKDEKGSFYLPENLRVKYGTEVKRVFNGSTWACINSGRWIDGGWRRFSHDSSCKLCFGKLA